MTHYVHILTNAAAEAYIMVLKGRRALDTIKNVCLAPTDEYFKKNATRCRFVQDNVDSLTLIHHKVNEELTTYAQVMSYREYFTKKFEENGYMIIDEGHYDKMEEVADKHFSFVLKFVDAKECMKKYGLKKLSQARKSMSVREFIETFGNRQFA